MPWQDLEYFKFTCLKNEFQSIYKYPVTMVLIHQRASIVQKLLRKECVCMQIEGEITSKDFYQNAVFVIMQVLLGRRALPSLFTADKHQYEYQSVHRHLSVPHTADCVRKLSRGSWGRGWRRFRCWKWVRHSVMF